MKNSSVNLISPFSCILRPSKRARTAPTIRHPPRAQAMGIFPATDPLLNFASKLGFEVLFYTPRHTPWHLFFVLIVHNLIFLVVRHASSCLRTEWS